MTVETIRISDREQWLALRRRDVTASVAGCLLGLHEYTTTYGLWAEKTGRIEPDGDNEALRRGRLLEPVAIQLLAEERPTWKLTPPGVYLRDPAARIGATPDLYAFDPERGEGVVQVKTTADIIFRQKWIDRDTRGVELPLWIAVQAMIEASLSGRAWADVALMVCGIGLNMHVFNVPIHAGVLKRVRAEVARFWDVVEAGGEMPPDYERDAHRIAQIYREEDDSAVDLTTDNRIHGLCRDRHRLRGEIRAAEAALKPVEAEILHKLGNASTAYIGEGEVITAKTQRRDEHVVAASSFRVLRTPRYPDRAAKAEDTGGPF